jgi:UDPglucose 6-dehydrogenase|tara:strand:+ start:15992 stop:17221 length:1230 start_codon:yes stop_codon:yes gene_type:complete
MKIGFIGTGKLGMPCAEAIASKGHDVTGYDIEKRKSHLINMFPTIQGAVQDRDIVFIAVPTPHDPAYDGREPTAHLDPKDFSYDIVKEVMIEANKHMNKDQLLVLISTVLPGTTRKEFVKLVPNTRFVYNPYLIAMGSVAWDMVNPEMVMIGTEDGSETGDAKQLVDFYKTVMENNPRYEIGTWDECECIKVFYNTFISAKIGLVNMIQDVAEKQGNINVDVVTNALAHSDKRIMGPQYMTAGMGDGGGCHPRDNIALRFMANELGLGYDLFDSIMNAREIQASNLAKKLVTLSKENNMPIFIHGKAYKPGVPYCDGSYSLLVGHYCIELGVQPTYVDPLTGDINQPGIPCVILLAHSASTTYKYMKEEGDDNDQLYCTIPTGSVVVDPWRKYTSDKNKVIGYGNTRNV